jgi:hypothetical protein
MTTDRRPEARFHRTTLAKAFRPLARLAGVVGLVAGGLQVALFFGDGVGASEAALVGAWNVLQLPVAVALWAWLGPRSREVVNIATACGVGSLILWAASAITPSLAPLEAVWIGLSAVWYVGIGTAARTERRFLGALTLVVGLAAIGDAIVTVPEMLGNPLPDVLFMALGGWKIPLALVWSLVVGAELAIRPPARPAGAPDPFHPIG